MCHLRLMQPLSQGRTNSSVSRFLHLTTLTLSSVSCVSRLCETLAWLFPLHCVLFSVGSELSDLKKGSLAEIWAVSSLHPLPALRKSKPAPPRNLFLCFPFGNRSHHRRQHLCVFPSTSPLLYTSQDFPRQATKPQSHILPHPGKTMENAPHLLCHPKRTLFGAYNMFSSLASI